jgi:hypothetical protein
MQFLSSDPRRYLTQCTIPLALILACTLLLPSLSFAQPSSTGPLDSTFTYRDAFLPPGIPSVAVHTDESGMIWNPAGLALSNIFYLGYSWKGTYLREHLETSTHFVISKARGFAMGYVRDNYSEGVKNAFLLTLSPRLSNQFAVGWTGKWKGGFNFDVGVMMGVGRHLSLGFVGRNLRYKKNVRRYWESGLGIFPTRRIILTFDVIVEDSAWRKETGFGGAVYANLGRGVAIGTSYFTDGEGNNNIRASLKFRMSRNVIESEYASYTNDWQTVGIRFSARNP